MSSINSIQTPTAPIAGVREQSSYQCTVDSVRALHAAQDALIAVLPEVLERSITEPHFRSSLFADTHMTINSVIAKSAPHMERISSEVAIRLVENSSDTLCLVVPPPSEQVRMDNTQRSPVGEILFDAAWDADLRNELIANPTETLARELSKRGNEVSSTLPADLSIKVVAHEPGELVVVVPVAPKGSAEMTNSMTKDFGIDGVSPVVASTNGDTCRYTVDYCSTIFTTNSACGTSTCITHTWDCKRTTTW
ncbi:MAG: hypothetical protein ACK5GN_12350 [Pseudomonadota bacterium]|jgi:hypothetical protein